MEVIFLTPNMMNTYVAADTPEAFLDFFITCDIFTIVSLLSCFTGIITSPLKFFINKREKNVAFKNIKEKKISFLG